jgi:excisionase family DNA binding protein
MAESSKSHQPVVPAPQRLAFTMQETAALLGVNRATLYREIARGKLRTTHFAGRRLITPQIIDEYLRERTA